MSNTRLIAEIGCNHKGSLPIAKQMIESLANHNRSHPECPIYAAKFQKRHNVTLLTDEQYNSPHPNPENSYGKTYGEHREFLEFTLEEHDELKSYCEQKGLVYATSVWDVISAKQIVSLNPELIKVPSACNLNGELLQYLRDEYQGELHISLGMTSLSEYQKILSFMLERPDRMKQVVFYACTSTYPAEFEDLHLKKIRTLCGDMHRFGFKAVGFSGHHLGIAADIAALAYGATYFERHFTLNRSWKGTDHTASLEPAGLFKLARDLVNVDKALEGPTIPTMQDAEISVRDKLKGVCTL